jgi:adenosylmethionine-8-amino-7-oxononanoate aminotransferase
VKLASHLSELFDHRLNRVFYTDNGSSAIEAALKLSFQYHQNTGDTGRTGFVYISGAYHGETIGALSMSSLSFYKKVFEPLLVRSREVEGPDCLRCPFKLKRESCQGECIASAEQFFEEHGKTTSAVIIEPMVQCAAGMQIYSPVYLKKLRALTGKHGIHLICDEIASGFGRTGKMMASHHAGITPDIVCVSKGITGGFLPLAAVLTSETLYQAFYSDYHENKAFLHSHSYTGNPVSCQAACTVFEIFQESDWMSEIRRKGELIRKSVEELTDHPNVAEIRSIGMITAIELVKNKTTLERLDPSQRTGYRIYREAEKNGVLLRNLGDIIYFMPPYIIREDEIQLMTDTAKQAIRKILS